MTEIRQNTVWKFKAGRGDKYRRLRVKSVQPDNDKVGPYVEVRSFYLDEPVWPSKKDKRGDSRRQPKDMLLLKATILSDYECITTEWREGATSDSEIQTFGGDWSA